MKIGLNIIFVILTQTSICPLSGAREVESKPPINFDSVFEKASLPSNTEAILKSKYVCEMFNTRKLNQEPVGFDLLRGAVSKSAPSMKTLVDWAQPYNLNSRKSNSNLEAILKYYEISSPENEVRVSGDNYVLIRKPQSDYQMICYRRDQIFNDLGITESAYYNALGNKKFDKTKRCWTNSCSRIELVSTDSGFYFKQRQTFSPAGNGWDEKSLKIPWIPAKVKIEKKYNKAIPESKETQMAQGQI